jgi:hypothetical protein
MANQAGSTKHNNKTNNEEYDVDEDSQSDTKKKFLDNFTVELVEKAQNGKLTFNRKRRYY